MKRLIISWGLVAAAAMTLGLNAAEESRHDMDRARQAFITEAAAEARQDMTPLHHALRTLHDQLMILTGLPTLRIKHDNNQTLSNIERLNLQELFNGLAARAPVSAMVITGPNYRPDRINPATGAPYQPRLVFNQVIHNLNQRPEAAYAPNVPVTLAPDAPPLPEGEIISAHGQWFKATYPLRDRINDQTLPLLVDVVRNIKADPSPITNQPPTEDRLVFSAPIYAHDGTFSGAISLVIKQTALASLLPHGDFAIVSPGNGLAAGTLGENTLAQSMESVAAAMPDPRRIYSEAIPLHLPDSRHAWFLWAAKPDSAFTNGAEAASVAAARHRMLSTIGAVTAALLAFIWLIEKNLRQSQRLNATLAEARDLAEKSRAEAQEAAEMFKSLNDDITRLNIELSDKVTALDQAQDGAAQKTKLAELGKLIGSVAHELRNPLASAQTNAFILEHQLAGQGIDASATMGRIRHGLERCNEVITQLLDYSRGQAAHTTATDLDAWLEAFLETEAQHLPAVLELNLGLAGRSVDVDAERLGRALANLMANASEAMIGRDGKPLVIMAGRRPRIHVTTSANARRIEIIVNDNGPGIEAEVLEKIRDPLFTTKSFGTGLGLAAAEKTMELHGGGMEVASVKGTGARFTLWLPLSAADEAAA